MSLLSNSIKATSYLIALQGLSRILTFTLNQLILRYTTPSVFGFATIQLELLLNTILFLCREGFRISIQRLPADRDRAQEIINLSWLPVSAGLFLASTLSYLYIQRAPAESAAIPYFTTTVIVYGVSTVLELFSEPCYNTALQRMLFKVRASCEGFAVISRCLVTFLASLYGGQGFGAMAFALGQLAYSMTLLIAYRIQLPISVAPKRLKNSAWTSPGFLKLSIANTVQGLLKYVLTEGDKIMISWFSTNEEQGSYGLAANYGGLVARIVLQPIEEASRSYFSNALPHDDTNDQSKATAKLVLTSILRVYMLASIFLMSIAPRLITNVLPVLLRNSRWISVTDVLAAFCYYIPLLAINGILEAFVTATASPKLLRQQGLWWVLCSLAFGAAGYLFRGYHAPGLVYANCVNLSMRIVWAVRYLHGTFKDLEMSTVLPSKVSITAVATLAGIAYSADMSSQSLSSYLVKITGAGLATGLVVSLAEWKWAKTTYQALQDQSQK